MPKIRINNRVLIDFFPPWGRPEITLTGAAAEILAVILGFGILTGIIPVAEFKFALYGSIGYAVLRNIK